MSHVTIFPDTFSSQSPYFVTIEQIFNRIKSVKHKPLVDKIRRIEDKHERDNQKKLLPAILFAGKFTARKNAAFEQHAGYICLDFDKLGDRYEEVKEKLVANPHTVLLFRSPSGNGIKCVFRIPASISTHRDSARAIQAYFASEPSYDHFPDEARICYISHDSEAYFNPQAKVFTQLIEAPKPQVVEAESLITDYDQIYQNLKTWLETKRLEHYADGNKHKYLVKLAAACNRFGIEQHTCERLLRNDFSSVASPVAAEDFEQIVKKVYTLYRSSHGISFFDEKKTVYEKEEAASPSPGPAKASRYVSIESIPELPDEVAKDVIYVDSIRQQIKDVFSNGFKKASTTYFPEMDGLWKWKAGELTLMTGIMNHGKSTLMLQLMLIKSMKDGDKWAVFSPEQNPPDEFYLDLAHTYLGKSTMGDYANKCTEEELDQALDFLDAHFFFIYPESDAPTPQYINDRFREVIIKHRVTGCMIDPYNQLDNDIRKAGGREDLYLSAFLTGQKRFALDHQVFMLIVAHPNSGLQKVKSGENAGNYQAPDIYDLSGGAMWGNKCDNILVTYRPFYSTNSHDTTVQFISSKIKKQKITGIPGVCTMTFDRRTNRFLDSNRFNPLPTPFSIPDTPTPMTPYNSYASMQQHTNLLDWENPNGPF